MLLAKVIKIVCLGLYASVAANGKNPCINAASCASGTANINLRNCDITDADIADIETCFDSAGRSGITSISFSNNGLTTLPEDMFDGMPSLLVLVLERNNLSELPAGLFRGLESLAQLLLNANALRSLPPDIFQDMENFLDLYIGDNELTTLPAKLFDSTPYLNFLYIANNPDLQCIPENVGSTTYDDSTTYSQEITSAGFCDCTPADVVMCGEGTTCSPGELGYTCDLDEPPTECTIDGEACPTGEICCPIKLVCEVPLVDNAGACGDPHMTGFRGQKFDFTGNDGAWYALISDLPSIHLNMRVTAPVPSLPEITYITGLSVSTIDADGLDHSIIISVKDPHTLVSACPTGVVSCLAEGSLAVFLDGKEALFAPGTAKLGQGVSVSAVNLPGACRSFGFEKYWEYKKMQSTQHGRMMIDEQSMGDWILKDPTATNMEECARYVTRVMVEDDGMLKHQSEHASFQITTPTASIRLSHGKLHQIATRDPTGRFDLPDHLTWQMNVAIDQNDLSQDVGGILGETFWPTIDPVGNAIMHGMGSIRGTEEDYRVVGPAEVNFAQGTRHF